MPSDSPENRYARQIQFAPIGREGQDRLAQARVAVLGCGALGSVAAEILARAGVGTLRLIDRDVVEWTNLQRQSLYTEHDATEGLSKAGAAYQRLAAINHTITIVPLVADVNSHNIGEVVGEVDFVVDAADNFLLRFLLNDWSLKNRTPWVHGGCVGATGQVKLFSGLGSPCFRCLVPEPPAAAAVDTCDTAGVVGSATHVIASLQATEAIKWLSGNRDAVRKTLLSVDLWHNRIRELSLPDAICQACRACGQRHYDFLDGLQAIESEAASVLCGRDAVQIQTSSRSIDLARLAQRWQGIGSVQQTPFFVRLRPNDIHSLTVFRDGRAVITGTDQISEARVLCDRFIGG